jgi:hypothetical protein
MQTQDLGADGRQSNLTRFYGPAKRCRNQSKEYHTCMRVKSAPRIDF